MTKENGGSSSAGDALDAALAFYRLCRTLRSGQWARNITWERLSTLNIIARREPVSITELSVMQAVTAPTISRTVAALENEALVRYVANRTDRRSVLVMSTAKGRATLQKSMTRTLREVAELLCRLDAAELDAMAEAIQIARESKK